MLASKQQHAFSQEKTSGLDSQCQGCRFLRFCHAGCPAHRLSRGPEEGTLNYLCEGYKLFFDHALPQLQAMAAPLREEPRGRLDKWPGSAGY